MKKIVFQLCAVALLVSCQQELITESYKEDNLTRPLSMLSEITITDLPQAKIGEQIPNPLEISNVKKAYDMLGLATKTGFNSSDIVPTHHYVAFMPSNEEEQAAVQSIDENQIIIHYFPLDYEVSDGILARDERFMTNGYSYYWAYVPVSFDLRTIKCPYIVYYDIVALDDEIVFTKSKTIDSSTLVDELIKTAYSICGIEVKPIIQTKADVHPSGYLKFYDSDYNSFRPVDGFKVRAVRGTHQCWMNCDENGYFYSSDTFKYAFQYEFMFRRDNFEVRKENDSNFAVIKLSGQTGPVNVNFADEESCFMATIVRAATRYYYGNINGLRRPPIPAGNLYRPYFKAVLGSAEDPIERGHFYLRYFGSIYNQPEIYIYKENGDGKRTNQSVFETTIHELAHVSMWYDKPDYEETEDIVKESFAKGIAWALTSLDYQSDYSPNYYRRSYTGIIQDLIDSAGIQKECNTIAEKANNGEWTFIENDKSYLDYISGIDIVDIEETARTSRTWDEWREGLIDRYPNKAAHILNSFVFWRY